MHLITRSIASQNVFDNLGAGTRQITVCDSRWPSNCTSYNNIGDSFQAFHQDRSNVRRAKTCTNNSKGWPFDVTRGSREGQTGHPKCKIDGGGEKVGKKPAGRIYARIRLCWSIGPAFSLHTPGAASLLRKLIDSIFKHQSISEEYGTCNAI